jgi:hypothetical protein
MILNKSISIYDTQDNKELARVLARTLNSVTLMNEYSLNNSKCNYNEIININMKKNEKSQILNADLLSKRIKLKLKSKEIGNRNIKFTIFKIFNNLNKKYKTINIAMLNNKYKVNN